MRICCQNCGGFPEGCDMCNETGLCCPRCRGARFLARHRKGQGSAMVRCSTCQIELSDGWQFDGGCAMTAILRYIDDWFDGVLPDEVLAHRAEVEAEAKERAQHQPAARGRWKHG